ncbi:MAG TPA: protein phosphatase 2C domain-containing protein [Aridibacter sp.]|nr:protein phosphatase 2C domain-containing protein [Aridibacter sp.]
MLNVEVHATSHVGQIRKGNEDNYLVLRLSDAQKWTSRQDDGDAVIESREFEVDDKGIILAVSDGMGGALAGEVASKMAVETVGETMTEADPEKTISPNDFGNTLVGRLYDSIVYANHKIHQKGREPEFQGMGATFTGVGITNGAVDLVQIGDSRTYLIRNAKIYQVTKDQSLVQQLIDSGQISAEEAETHALKNVILQALGAQNEIYPVAARLIPHRDDILIICSDGLSNKIDSVDMQKIVFEHLEDLKQAVAKLVEVANERGGEDNITLIIARLTGSSLEEPTDDEIQLEAVSPESIHDTAEQDTAEIL